MTEHLVYRLSTALGSMGTLAGNERRGSDDWPARSAIGGMLGAALGVQRTDRGSQDALESDYAIGLSRHHLGPMLTDYHTAQTVPTSVVKRPDSRPQALALGKAKGARALSTLITHREYHQGCVFDVVVVPTVDTPCWPLAALRDALLRPRYVLFFGRKACPLDHPLVPTLFDASNALEALERYAGTLSGSETEAPAEWLLDPRLADAAGQGGRSILRRDGVADRKSWTFADRESVLVNSNGAHGS